MSSYHFFPNNKSHSNLTPRDTAKAAPVTRKGKQKYCCSSLVLKAATCDYFWSSPHLKRKARGNQSRRKQAGDAITTTLSHGLILMSPLPVITQP